MSPHLPADVTRRLVDEVEGLQQELRDLRAAHEEIVRIVTDLEDPWTQVRALLNALHRHTT